MFNFQMNNYVASWGVNELIKSDGMMQKDIPLEKNYTFIYMSLSKNKYNKCLNSVYHCITRKLRRHLQLRLHEKFQTKSFRRYLIELVYTAPN